MFFFIYGSLKKGLHNHSFLKDRGANFIKTVSTLEPTFDLISLSAFPGLIPGNFYVQGELFDIPQRHVYELDRFEGTPDFYKRIKLKICPLKEVFGYMYMGETQGRQGIPVSNIKNTKIWT